MTELKTLKDWMKKWKIDIKLDPSLQDLKQEAVNWIKFFRNMPYKCLGIALEDAKKGESITLMTSIDEEFIKHFFNLADEDLK